MLVLRLNLQDYNSPFLSGANHSNGMLLSVLMNISYLRLKLFLI